MATCTCRKLDALLHLAVRLEHREDGQVVQIIAILLDKVEELLLEDFYLLFLDQGLLASVLFVHPVVSFFDLVCTDGRDFRESQLGNPRAD